MRAFRTVPFALAACLVLLIAIAIAGDALAAKPTLTRDAWDDTFVDPNFCGAGLAVSVHTVGTGSVWIRFNQGTYAIFSDHIHGQDTLTGPNGAVITVEYNHHGHDDNVVDNGDGTYTDYWTERGVIEKVTFPDGTVVFDRGQITWKFIYGDAGTPGDPSDDFFIDFKGIVDYTGQMPGQTGVDLCAAAVAAFSA